MFSSSPTLRWQLRGGGENLRPSS